jgi:glutathione S-transferase
VPLIKIDDKWIADSDVIVKVLEDAYPCPPLATLGLTCWGQGIFPAAMAFFKSKNPSDGTEKVLVCELDSINDHLRKNGPYIDGKYLTSADVALAPKLYIIQIALAHYKNWSNIEPFYPALSRYMKLMFNLPAFRKTCAPPAVVVKGWAKHWT